MKNRKGKMSFRKMFVRAFAAFFAFYLGIMSLFTVVQYKNNQNAHRSRRLEFINSIKQWMPLSTEFSMKEQNLDTSLSYLLIMARDAAGVNETYIRAALYTEEGKEVAKTGSYITCPGANRVNRQQVSNKTSYFGLVDVEKYLSSEQVAKLYAFKQEESTTLKYGLAVSGYLEKDEVIPQVIKIYREEWRPD